MRLRDIKVNDVLISEDGYFVIVRQDKDEDLFGQLICEPTHSCAKIPYCLNNGVGYTKIKNYFVKEKK